MLAPIELKSKEAKATIAPLEWRPCSTILLQLWFGMLEEFIGLTAAIDRKRTETMRSFFVPTNSVQMCICEVK